MTNIWTEHDINRFSQEGEDDFVVATKCIIDRLSLNIIKGQPEYSLPDKVVDIRRITWKTHHVLPLPNRLYRENCWNDRSGRPDFYLYSNTSSNKIKFYPTPVENLFPVTGDLYLASAISNGLIIEFYRTSDYNKFQIPFFLRRRLLKSYVLKKCFSQENQGQNIKSSLYFENKYKLFLELYGMLLQEMVGKPRKLILGPQEDWTAVNYNFYGGHKENLPDRYRVTGVNQGE